MPRPTHTGARILADWLFVLGATIILPMMLVNHVMAALSTWPLPHA